MSRAELIKKVRESGHTVRETESVYQIFAKPEFMKELENQGYLKPEEYEAVKNRNNLFKLYKDGVYVYQYGKKRVLRYSKVS